MVKQVGVGEREGEMGPAVRWNRSYCILSSFSTSCSRLSLILQHAPAASVPIAERAIVPAPATDVAVAHRTTALVVRTQGLQVRTSS